MREAANAQTDTPDADCALTGSPPLAQVMWLAQTVLCKGYQCGCLPPALGEGEGAPSAGDCAQAGGAGGGGVGGGFGSNSNG